MIMVIKEIDYIYEEAERLSKGLNPIDKGRLARYLLDEGKAEKNSVLSFCRVLMLHLLKCIHQPERTSRSWHNSIKNSYDSLYAYIGESKQLYNYLKDNFDKVYRRARSDASDETRLPLTTFPTENIFIIDKILDEDWIYDFLEEHPIVEW